MTKSKRRNSFCVPSLPPLGSSSSNATHTKTSNVGDRPPLPPAGHFLRNVNLNGNLLDIPDPPSPPRRNARRQSSPMLLPLRDVTNGESDNDTSAVSAARGASSSVITTRKRSRKSLCHVPSPATEMEQSNDEQVMNETASLPKDDDKTPEGDNDDEVEAKTPSICFDDDDDVVVSSSKRQKRRESMILPSDMAPLPMDETSDDSSPPSDNAAEISNEDMNVDKETMEDALLELDDEEEDNVSSKRASRRLSIVLPCNIASFQDEVANQVLNDEDSPMEQAMQEDKALPIKKRQSMFLPSDASLLPDEAEAKEYFGQLQSQQAKKKTDAIEQGSTGNDDTRISTNKLSATDIAFSKDLIHGQVSLVAHQEGDGAVVVPAALEAHHLRNLVREYCSLPLAERNMSKQAQDIERLTGYALVPPSAKQQKLKDKSGIDLNWSGSPQSDENAAAEQQVVTSQNDSARAKRSMLLKLGAVVDLMDKRKAQDTKQMEKSTGCRFHRSRSGKYRYYHVSTNRKASPAQYEKLYLAAVKQSKRKMSKRIQDWLRQSEKSSDMSEGEIHEQCVELSTLVEDAQQPVEQDKSGALETSPGNDSDQPQVMDRSTSESDMEESPSDSSEMESKNSPPRVVVDQAKDNAQAHDEADAVEKRSDTATLSLPDTSLLEVDTTVSPTASSDSNNSSDANETLSTENDELLLPLPSRDEASDDPAIAAAEERLWSEIDAALERYSRRVIAIRQARAASQQDNH